MAYLVLKSTDDKSYIGPIEEFSWLDYYVVYSFGVYALACI